MTATTGNISARETADDTTLAALQAPNQKQAARRRFFAMFGIGLAVAAVLAGAWWVLVASHHVRTDNAYVDANVAKVSAETSGTVLRVNAEETQPVRAGDVLVLIDPADAQVAAAQAQAELARAERRVRQYMANVGAASANVGVAQARLVKAEADLRRRQKLSSSGTISDEELTSARTNYDAAIAALASARSEQEAQEALTSGADVSSNPEVQAARAALDAAELALSRTTIRSPIDGVIAEKRVALGQRVQIGAPLLTVVPLSAVYVNANYKENQLRRVRVGQSAKLTSDLYGGSVVYHGKVAGIGGGTGAAFAVIPAQNASGNWIKVVQRVPVKITLDPEELRAHPLRVGLSMTADINIRD